MISLRFRLASLGLALGTSLLLASTAPLTAQSELSNMDRDMLRGEIRDYLLENPEVIREALVVLEQRRAVEEAEREQALVTAKSAEIFEDGYSFVGGNLDGDITVVEFQDYRCGYCKRAHGEVQELVESDGNIRLIIKEFPILGPDSLLASRAAIATLITQGDEAYQAMTDALMTFDGPIGEATLDKIAANVGVDMSKTRAMMEDAEVTRRIAETRELAQELSISGTPTFIIGGQLVKGYLPLDNMRDVVEMARNSAE